jgi:hypothetical protein
MSAEERIVRVTLPALCPRYVELGVRVPLPPDPGEICGILTDEAYAVCVLCALGIDESGW